MLLITQAFFVLSLTFVWIVRHYSNFHRVNILFDSGQMHREHYARPFFSYTLAVLLHLL